MKMLIAALVAALPLVALAQGAAKDAVKPKPAAVAATGPVAKAVNRVARH